MKYTSFMLFESTEQMYVFFEKRRKKQENLKLPRTLINRNHFHIFRMEIILGLGEVFKALNIFSKKVWISSFFFFYICEVPNF